ncbi:MAG: PEP-CTERM sorting domain-containing protein [Planctomycetota bacterium]|nr:PEP-CTERM sorting domain-containing protein [Planctomycetota bacterium]
MEMATKTIMLLAILTLIVTPVMAEDVYDPPWEEDPTDPQWEGGVTTYQRWEFAENPTYPVEMDNKFGEPFVEVVNGEYPDIVPGPNDVDIPTWHIGPGGGKVKVTVQNNPDPNKVKLILFQITSDKAGDPGGPTTNPPGASQPRGPIQLPNANWYVFTWDIVIPGNPPEETIEMEFPESTNISEIVVHTMCVPEPATMTLLALGACLPLLRRRR